jgi:serine/threonine protein kinase
MSEKGNHFQEDQILIALYQCCHALKLAEQWNLVHSDIKPDNILVHNSGNLKLSDFGISTLYRAGEDGQ